jgi:hypothetical protein
MHYILHRDALKHRSVLSRDQNDSYTNTVTSTFVIVIPFCILTGVLGALNFIVDISDKSNTLHPLNRIKIYNMTSHHPRSLRHMHRKACDAPYIMIHDQYAHIYDLKLKIM